MGWRLGHDPGGRRMANGERLDRRLWRKQGGERLAAVGERRRCVSTEDIRRAPQQDHPYGGGGRMAAGVSDNVTEIYGEWGYTKARNKKFRR